MPKKRGGDAPGVLRLPDIAYEKAPFETTVNGEPLKLMGWVKGPGCPGRVHAEFARRYNQYQIAAETDTSSAPWNELLTDELRIIFELPYEMQDTLDLIASDGDRAVKILQHFRWFNIPDDAEGDDDPEAAGEDGKILTMGRSSPTSQPASEASAPTAAAG
jgi:hypothetical protein